MSILQNVAIPAIIAALSVGLLSSSEAAPAKFERTTNPAAQWFPQGSFGLFMHWGIHSVAGVQPSWAMIKNYPYGGELSPPERYYALTSQFNPQQYDPNKWMAAAKAAGMTYAVLTTKHHDGYALWPSKFGDMSTRQYMNSRDLLAPYVRACRKYGLKVGFYYSPPDWHYPGYKLSFEHNVPDPPRNWTPEQTQAEFEKYYAYIMGQIEELLTRYGKIDILWFDGCGFPGVSDMRVEQTLARIRQLQPGIVINNRYGGVGDYETPECQLPGGRPKGWWESCVIWNGHWGYNPNGHFQSNDWVLSSLVKARSWGGNILLNCGPAPDGTMPPGFYERCDELAAWMKHSRASLIGAGPTPGDDRANVPITTGEHVWYLHLLPRNKDAVEVHGVPEPKSVKLLRTGEAIPYTRTGDSLSLQVPDALRTSLDDVVALTWDKPVK